MTKILRSLLCTAALAALVLAACDSDGNSAINRDRQNSFLTATDLTTMTDKMAESLASDPAVVALARQKPLVIVMAPIINDTNEIIRGNQKELYVHRVRALLAEKQNLRSQFTFVLNRAAWEKLQAEEGLSAAQLGPVETRLQPDFVLTGHFFADTNASSQTRRDYYLCTYQLTRLGSAEVIWEGKYETQKFIKKGMLD